MKVIVDSRAWLPKKDLTQEQLVKLRDVLTIIPTKTSEHDGDDPTPLPLYVEDADYIGIPRQYFMERKRDHHEVELRVTDGDHARWAGPISFSGTLRQEQQEAMDVVVPKLKGGLLGGIIRATPGWGKCFEISSTYLFEYPTGKRVPLKDLISSTPLVPSLKDDGRVATVRAAKVWAAGTKETRRLVLGSGARLDVSFDHPILTQKGWVKAADIPVGREMLVATARSIPEPSSPSEVSDSEVIVAGLYTADGAGLHLGASTYCKGDNNLVRLFEEHAPKIPGFKTFGERTYYKGAWYVRPHGLRPWIEEWGLDKSSKDKRFPPKVFQLPNRQLALFLRAYLSDGSVYASKPYKLEVSTSSEEMAFEIMDAFKRFGLRLAKSYAPKRSHSGGPKHAAWRLQLSDKDSLLLFFERIGAPLGKEREGEELKALLLESETNTNWDVVPVGREELREVRKALPNVSYKDWKRLTQGGSMRWMGRTRFQRLVEETGYDGELASLAHSDVVWEAVSSNESIGIREVADLTVPETGNVVANGVISHNTVACCALIDALKVPTLVVVHKEFLMDQWVERMQQFLPGVKIGIAQQNVCDYTGKHVVVAMVHSLADPGRYPDSFYNWPGLVITDEVHRIGAKTWSPVPAMFPARYRIGVSATPRRKDGADNVFYYHMGRILFAAKEQRMVPRVRRVWSNFRFAKTPNFNPNVISRSVLVNILCKSRARNRLIVSQAALAAKAGRKILVLSERLEHLSTLEAMLLKEMKDEPPTTGYYVGGMTAEERAEAATKQVIFATVQFASEGMDIPPLDTLFITSPQSDIEQAVGRILRPYPGKKEPIVVDFRDDKVAKFKRNGESRDRYYKRIGVKD